MSIKYDDLLAMEKDTKLGNMPAKRRLDVKLFYDEHIKMSKYIKETSRELSA